MYISEQILNADDLYELSENASNLVDVKYQLTDAELDWLDFVSGKYSIADWINDNMEDGILTIESFGLSKALDDDSDGWGKAVCLSDETALQKIFFWCYNGE